MIPSGWIVPLLIALPNIAWAVAPSRPGSPPVPGPPDPEPGFLVLVERAGRVGIFALPFFLDVQFTTVLDRLCLAVAALALALYYLGWLRYFRGGRLPELLYRPLARMPVPLAITPVLYFLACSGPTRSPALALTTLAFGSAHVSLSLRRARASQPQRPADAMSPPLPPDARPESRRSAPFVAIMGSPRVMRVYYLEIVTEEVAAVCAAYAASQGLRFGEPDARLGNARTAALSGGGLVGVRAPLHETEGPVVRPYWLVDDIDQALAAAVGAGGSVAHPPLEISGHGTFAIYIHGGIQHGLWQLRARSGS